MRKNLIYRGMMLLASALTIASCTNDDDIAQGGTRKALDVNVAVQDVAGSRAMVFGQYLAANSEIGVSVVADADGGNYDGIATGYTNVAYRATGESTSQTWAASDASKQILLSGTAGKAIAYYPYASTVTDYTAIPVDIADQTDWMYSGEVGPLNDAAPSAEFVMQHALTALNVNFVCDDAYTGAGEVSVLTVTSDGLATNGIFSAVDGAFASTTGAGSAVSVIDAPFTLDGTTLTNQENPYMFVPATDETKDFTVTATVDGKAYNVGVAMNETFVPGKMYKLNVKVTNTGLTVSKVTLTDWVIDTTLPEGTFEPEIAPVAPTINSAGVANGVYVITATGELVDESTADPTAIGVALITANQRIMIEKNGEDKTEIIKVAYEADAATDTNYKYFYWGSYGTDVNGIANCSDETAGKADFNGKANTAAIIATPDTDTYTTCGNMGTYCTKFNEMSGIYSDWYVPALGQLWEIYTNRTDINTALTNIGSTAFVSGYHWSSSEMEAIIAWSVSFNDGDMLYYVKNDLDYVLFVRDIN